MEWSVVDEGDRFRSEEIDGDFASSIGKESMA